MLSSKFLVVSFLYLFYATGVVVALPRGGDQFCESVRTVTIVQTVTPNQPPPSSSPPNNANSPPSVVTQRPGNVNLGNGNDNKNGNPKQGGVNGKNNSKTSSSGLPTTSLPPLSTTNRSLAAPPTATPPTNNNKNGNPKNGNPGDNNSGNDNSDNGNPDTSLTLDPSVIQKINGKGQGAGQVDSLVSSNNFINVCIGKTLTAGKQVQAGSCNPTPIGDIPSVDNMPSVKFNSPTNFDTIAANTPFTISLQINNMVTGTFTNAANTYFAAPQQLVGGKIQGHNHVTVQQMASLDSTQPLDPKVFAFFKGLNGVANNGVLTATVTNGLPPGFYRISSISAAGNHQEAIGPVAQRGSFNDVVYITVTQGGKNSNANSVPSSSVPPVNSTSSTVLPTSVSSDVLSSSVLSPAVSSTSPVVSPSDDGGKGGKDSKTPPTDSLPVSTSSSPDVSPTAPPPAPTGTDGKNGGGKNNDGKNDNASPSDSPTPSSTGGKNGGKDDNPTSTPLPDTPTPTAGNDKPDTKDPVVSSSSALPDPTPKGGKDSQGGNGRNSKRMHKRSHLA